MKFYKILFIRLSLLVILGVGSTSVRGDDDFGNHSNKDLQALESLLLLQSDEPSFKGVTTFFRMAEEYKRGVVVEVNEFLPYEFLNPSSLSDVFWQRVHEGIAYRSAYRRQVLARLETPEARALGVYLGDPLREILQSLNDLENKQRRNSPRPLIQREAEALATEEMRKTYPDFEKVDDPYLRGEYQRLVNRYLLSHEIISHRPDATDRKETLDEWKRLQASKIQHIIDINTHAVLKIIFEINREFLKWKKWDDDRFLFSRSFHPDDVSLTRIDRENIERDMYIILEGNSFLYLWGKRLVFIQDLFHYAPYALEERGDFFKAAILRKIDIESACLSGMINSWNHSMTISKMRREIEWRIKFFTEQFLGAEKGLVGRLIFPTDLINYKWWGYSKGFDFWKEIEKRARDNHRPEFPFHSQQPRVLETSGERVEEFKTLLPSGDVQSGTHISKKEMEEREKIVLFRLRKDSLFSELPDSFEIPYFDEVARSSLIEIDGKGEKGFSIETIEPTSVDLTHHVIVIPKPIGFELTALRVRDSSGKELRHGIDYEIIGNLEKNILFIKILSHEENSYLFSADFRKEDSRSESVGALSLQKLDSDRLSLLAEELEKSGLLVLSQNLKRFIESAKKRNIEISVTDLEKIFKESALYSYQSDNESNSKIGTGGVFDSYRRFLNEEGRIFAQCSATNQLFADALKFCFKNNPAVVVENRSVLIREGGNELRKSGYHLRTYLYIGSKRVAVLDATPALFDKRDFVARGEEERGEEERRENLNKRLEKDIQTLKKDREELLKNQSIYSGNQGRRFDPSEPFVRAVKWNSILIAFLEGEIDLSQAGQRLKEIYPDKKGAFQNISNFILFIREAAREENEKLKRGIDKLRRGEMKRFTEYSNPIFYIRIEQVFLHIDQILGSLDSVSVLKFLGRNDTAERNSPTRVTDIEEAPMLIRERGASETGRGGGTAARGGNPPRSSTFAGSLTKFTLALALKEAMKEALTGKEANFSHIFSDEQVVGYGSFSATAALGESLSARVGDGIASRTGLKAFSSKASMISPYRLGSYAFFMTLGMQADQIARLTLSGIKDHKDVSAALSDALNIWWSQFEADEAVLTTAGFLAAKPLISPFVRAVQSRWVQSIRNLQKSVRWGHRGLKVLEGATGNLAFMVIEEAIVLLTVDILMEEYVAWKKEGELKEKVGSIFKQLEGEVQKITKDNAQESAANMAALFEELRAVRIGVIHTEEGKVKDKYEAFQKALNELIDHKSGMFWKDTKAMLSALDVKKSSEYEACQEMHKEAFGGGDYDGSQFERNYLCNHLAFLKIWAKKLEDVKKRYAEYQLAYAISENRKNHKKALTFDFLKDFDLSAIRSDVVFDIKHSNIRDIYQLEQSYYELSLQKIAKKFSGREQEAGFFVIPSEHEEEMKVISDAINRVKEESMAGEVVFETSYEQMKEEDVKAELERPDLMSVILAEIVKEDHFWIELGVGAKNGDGIFSAFNPNRIHVMNDANCILSEMLGVSDDVVSLETRDDRAWLSCDQFVELPLPPDEYHRREKLGFFIDAYFAHPPEPGIRQT